MSVSKDETIAEVYQLRADSAVPVTVISETSVTDAVNRFLLVLFVELVVSILAREIRDALLRRWLHGPQ